MLKQMPLWFVIIFAFFLLITISEAQAHPTLDGKLMI